MNTKLKTIGLGLALLAAPMFVSTVNAQQWVPGTSTQGVSTTFTDATPAAAQTITAQPSHTFTLNQNGTLSGRVASIDQETRTAQGLAGLDVFFVQNNRVVKRSQTDRDGNFTVQGLPQGAYSFFAAGQKSIAAYGVFVTGNQGAATSNMLEATTASTGYAGLQKLLAQSIPAEVAAAMNSNMQSVSDATTTTTPQQYQLQNGRLNGRVSSLFAAGQQTAGIQVFLIQGDQAVAQVQTSAQGTFSIPDVEPGIYDFVAVSNNGFTATRLEAIGSTSPMSQVSFARTSPQEMDIALTTPRTVDTQFASQPVDYAVGNVAMEPSYYAPVEYAGESIAYGGASGGSGGLVRNFRGFSGGGIVRGRFGGMRAGGLGGRLGRLGGGSRAGQLLVLGGLTGGIIAIADDDADDVSPTN